MSAKEPDEIEFLKNKALLAIAEGTMMTLTFAESGQPHPRGFPKQKRMGKNADGVTYAYDPVRILVWMRKNGLLPLKGEKK